MGFTCDNCGEREIWVFQSEVEKGICWDCHRQKGYAETERMKKHREANAWLTGAEKVDKE